jgi:hypothetical protein
VARRVALAVGSSAAVLGLLAVLVVAVPPSSINVPFG